VVAGGVVRGSDLALVGEATIDFIRQFSVDLAIIGVSAIDAQGALLDYDYREVRVAQTIIANARRVCLVADGSKFERNAPVRIGTLRDIDLLITDQAPPPAIAAACEAAGVEVQVA
jgi:DeoR family glycerol-3-phosphate regulon repressor